MSSYVNDGAIRGRGRIIHYPYRCLSVHEEVTALVPREHRTYCALDRLTELTNLYSPEGRVENGELRIVSPITTYSIGYSEASYGHPVVVRLVE